MSFEESWKQKEAEGYQYGPGPIAQVRLGWDMRDPELEKANEKIAALEDRVAELEADNQDFIDERIRLETYLQWLTAEINSGGGT